MDEFGGYETGRVFVSDAGPVLGFWAPPELGLSPVKLSSLDLRPPPREWGTLEESERPLLCPGTPLVFGYLEKVQHLRLEVDASGLQLGNYAQ